MDDKLANLVVTDPPYNVNYEGTSGKIKNDNMENGAFYDFLLAAFTSRMSTGGMNCPLVMNERQYALTISEDVANTLTSTDYKGTQCVFEPTAYCICSKASNSMRSDNPNSGIYQAETSRTIDQIGGNPSCNHYP